MAGPGPRGQVPFRPGPGHPALGGALIPGLALRPSRGGLKRVSARTHPGEDGTDEAAAKAGGTPWKVPDPGRRGTLSAPGLCRPGLSAASTQETPGVSAPRLPSHRRNSLRPFEPDLARAMPPHDQTPPEVPLCRAGREIYKHKLRTLSRTRPAATPRAVILGRREA